VSTNSPILSVDNLKVALGGVSILDIPSFYLHEKEFLSLIGPNGSGKSTLLLALNVLLRPVSGQIRYRGSVVSSREEIITYRRRLSMVFQEPLLFDTTVYKNVASGLKIRGLSRDEIRARVMKYLAWFKIEHLANRSARKLSGGEAQRTSLARAFAIEPEIIFLDEPFSALDPPTRQALTDDLEKIIHDTGITALMVTHDQSEALRMSDRIAVMQGGAIVQHGTPADVMNNPVNEFVASFVGMECIVVGTVANNRDGILTVSVGWREIEAVGEVPVHTKVYCGIRPENVILDTVRPESLSSARNLFPAVIQATASMGPFLKVSLDCGFPLVAYVTRESYASLALEEGKEVFASFKATAVHLIPDGK
jgi:tungstate transport system ATP-binding protein